MSAVPPARSLRFCMVTTFYPPYHFGGDGILVYRLSQTLAERGHHIDVIHSTDAYHLQRRGRPNDDFPSHPNVVRHELGSGRPGLAALASHQLGRPAWYRRRLHELLEGRRYDVIHYHNVSLMGGPGVLRVGDALKLYTAHEYWLICPTHVLFKFQREACTARSCLACTLRYRRPPQLWRYTGHLRACADHVDCFIMPSRFTMEKHRAEGLDRPMVVLPNFVPVPSGVGAPANTVRDLPDTFFLFVGRLEKLKGVQDLIALFREYREASLVIAGAGDYEEALRRQADALPNVRFIGPVPPRELGALYVKAIAVVIPSLWYEVCPLVIGEALAHGTPIICRRIGALTELVEESAAGFTFETLGECRDAMERLRLEPGLRSALGARGQQVAATKWSVDAHVASYLALISRLGAARGSGSGDGTAAGARRST